MVYPVVWSDSAFVSAQRFLSDDPDGLLTVFDRAELLSEEPRPPSAARWGSERFRLRVGRYRLLYEVSKDMVTIIHLGRRQ